MGKFSSQNSRELHEETGEEEKRVTLGTSSARASSWKKDPSSVTKNKGGALSDYYPSEVSSPGVPRAVEWQERKDPDDMLSISEHLVDSSRPSNLFSSFHTR